MHDAFEIVRLVEKLPLKICAIATWADSFILCTCSPRNEAHLLVYNIKESTDLDKIYDARLTKTLKKYTVKPITQLAVVPEHNIFLGLSDNEVFFADLESFVILGHLPKSRGATYFAVDWQKLRGRVGFGRELRVGVATKRRLQLYEYKRNTFTITKADHNFPDTPKAFAWVGDSLIVCIKKDLYHVTIDGDTKELFAIGTNRTEPCLLPLMSGEILVLKEEMQISLDSSAKPTQQQPLVWSDLPMAIEHVHPFIVGLLPKGIEIRALEQKIQVQVVRMPDSVKFITGSKNTLIASQSQVYKLEPKPFEQQVSQLVQQRQFDLALQMAELIDEDRESKQERRNGIVRRFAFYEFSNHKFKESLEHYLEIKEDPVNVIGLYPNLLPSELRDLISRNHPTKPPVLSGDDLEEAMKHLITYLTQMRYQEQQKLQKHQKAEIAEHCLQDSDLKTVTERLQLIDTTLLKCYIKTGNNTLIGSLVRLPDNYLHMAESERVLRNEEKYQELIDLFKSKREHKKALQMLRQFSKGPVNGLSGVWPTIGYLQNLRGEHIDLVLEYSKWIIKEKEEDGLRIFTEESSEVESWPRDKVLDHLSSFAPKLVIPYLEHIIERLEDTTPFFHNRLVEIYREKVWTLLEDYKQTSGAQQIHVPHAGEENGELGVLRTKLLRFLKMSKHYEASLHISKFPKEDMFEERALLLSRLGRHEVALAIYAHILKEPRKAEEYCCNNYDPDKEESHEVYLSLIRMYLRPPDLREYGVPVPEPNVEAALKVLATHHHQVDTAEVLRLLPDDIRLSDISEFLKTILKEKTLMMRKTQVIRSLLHAEHLQVSLQKINDESPSFTISDETLCAVCNRRLGTSAFARYPDGMIVHYYCAKIPEDQGAQTDTANSSSTSDSYQRSMYRDLVDDTYDSANPF